MATSPLERSLAMYKGLVKVSALINAITDFDELLSAILDVAWKVTDAEASSLFLTNENGDLRLAIARGLDGGVTQPDIVVPRGRGIAGWVLEHGKPLLVRDAYKDDRFFREADEKSGFHTRSILCVPLQRDGTEIGVLQVLNPRNRDAFDEVDLEAFTAYGHLVATAIDKLRFLDRRAAQARVDQDLALAREIQRSFLPRRLPEAPGTQFAAMSRPALNIGGDFYDVVEVAEDEIFFVIADVSGKGISAALLAAQSLSYLRLIIRPGLPPVEALAQWNEQLCGNTIQGMFITAIVGRVTPSKRAVEIVSAGHPQPVLLSGGTARSLNTRGCPPVAILPKMQSQPISVDCREGDVLVFFTDGLTESCDATDVALGEEGVLRLLEQAPGESADALVEAITAGEALHRGAADPQDDLTALVIAFQ